MLKREQMKRFAHERSWLPSFGKTGMFTLRWSIFINGRRYSIEVTQHQSPLAARP